MYSLLISYIARSSTALLIKICRVPLQFAKKGQLRESKYFLLNASIGGNTLTFFCIARLFVVIRISSNLVCVYC